MENKNESSKEIEFAINSMTNRLMELNKNVLALRVTDARVKTETDELKQLTTALIEQQEMHFQNLSASISKLTDGINNSVMNKPLPQYNYLLLTYLTILTLAILVSTYYLSKKIEGVIRDAEKAALIMENK